MRIEEIGAATLVNADCREIMSLIPENSLDSVVCDPPYGLSFMGKGWDHGVPGVEFWIEALRVAKPGAHLLAFGGTRTFHRLMVAIEDAGWQYRDTIMWVYGSGFPKSLNGPWGGTALKPAWEPIIVARKPLAGTVAENVQQYGTGGLNIDGCRVEISENLNGGAYSEDRKPSDSEWVARGGTIHSFAGKEFEQPVGRWPANLIHDGSEEVLACFPTTTSGTGAVKKVSSADEHGNAGAAYGAESRASGEPMICYGDTGSAARFFYCAKASKADRNEGCGALPDREGGIRSETSGQHITRRDGNDPGPVKNNHPTVKPNALMRYLCRLVTPLKGIVLDPFMGSGSTGKAALQEGFGFVGIDNDVEHGYFDIACARIRATA